MTSPPEPSFASTRREPSSVSTRSTRACSALPAAARSEGSRMAATGSSMERPRGKGTAPSTGSASRGSSPTPSSSTAAAIGEGFSLSVGPLTEANGAIYGTALFPFAVFRLDGSVATIVHQFTGPDGVYPSAGLLLGSDGDLYGTASRRRRVPHGNRVPHRCGRNLRTAPLLHGRGRQRSRPPV